MNDTDRDINAHDGRTLSTPYDNEPSEPTIPLELTIHPLQFRWAEWLTRSRDCDARVKIVTLVSINQAHAIVRVISEWQAEVDAWLSTFSAEKREDVVSLCNAELDMLWEIIDPGYQGVPKPKLGGDEFTDFRERFYEGLPLAIAVQRLKFPQADTLLSAWKRLEDFAEQKGWLP